MLLSVVGVGVAVVGDDRKRLQLEDTGREGRKRLEERDLSVFIVVVAVVGNQKRLEETTERDLSVFVVTVAEIYFARR